MNKRQANKRRLAQALTQYQTSVLPAKPAKPAKPAELKEPDVEEEDEGEEENPF